MIIRVFRQIYCDDCTIGKMSIDGLFCCHTLEDITREDGKKVYGETAIPEGTYEVILDFSKRFQKDMPHILNVPGFEGIRIHSGNTSKDTHGCILVGLVKGSNYLERSRDAYRILYDKLKANVGNIKIIIE